MIVAPVGKADRNPFRRADQRGVGFQKHSGFEDIRRPVTHDLGGWILRGFFHLGDMRLVIGRRAGQLGRPRHRRQQFQAADRLAGRFVGHALDALAPLRQRRDHRVALHRIGRGIADFGLRFGDVVHEITTHHAQAIVIVAAELHYFTPVRLRIFEFMGKH